MEQQQQQLLLQAPPGEGVAERDGANSGSFRPRVASTASASTTGGGGGGGGPDVEMSPACVSVRDMIKHYDSVAKVEPSTGSAAGPPQRRQSQYTLPSIKSSFFGVNRFASLTNVRREDSEPDEGARTGRSTGRQSQSQSQSQVQNQVQSQSQGPNQNQIPSHGHGQSHGRPDDRLRRPSLLYNNNNNNSELSEGSTPTQSSQPRTSDRPFLHPSLDSADDSCSGVPAEASYQSKTTIAKTASGVRIIIDIFFDQEQGGVHGVGSEVIGSRVETDIPRSRILSEFQQQQTLLAATSASASERALN